MKLSKITLTLFLLFSTAANLVASFVDDEFDVFGNEFSLNSASNKDFLRPHHLIADQVASFANDEFDEFEFEAWDFDEYISNISNIDPFDIYQLSTKIKTNEHLESLKEIISNSQHNPSVIFEVMICNTYTKDTLKPSLLEIMKFLFKLGVNIDKSGLSLNRTVKIGNIELLELVLSHGADPRIEWGGHSAIDQALDKLNQASDEDKDWDAILKMLYAQVNLLEESQEVLNLCKYSNALKHVGNFNEASLE